MYGRITDKIELSLPSSGKLLVGTWVSNYSLLPKSVLLAEGWKPITEVRPEYDEATQYLEFDTAVDNGTNVVVTYKAVDIPVDYQTELENLLLEQMGV